MNIFEDFVYDTIYVIYPTNLISTIEKSDTVRNKWNIETGKNKTLDYEQTLASMRDNPDLIEIHKTGYPFYSFYEYI